MINVGAATEAEMKEKKARVEDALNATRAAVEEGVVAGGGVALVRAQKSLGDVEVAGDQLVGIDILSRTLEAPMREIANNAGVEGSLVVQHVKGQRGNTGYNAASGEYEDLVKAGIIDPTKVVRSALQNAASVAGLMLTTECVISDKPEENAGAAMPPGGMPPGGMGGMM